MSDATDLPRTHAADPEPTSLRPPSPARLAKEFVDAIVRDAAEMRADFASTVSKQEDDRIVDGPTSGDEATVADASLSIDEAIAAVSLAAVLAAEPPTFAALRDASPVLILRAADERTLPYYRSTLRVGVFGTGTTVLTDGALDEAVFSGVKATGRCAVVLECDHDRRQRSNLENRATTALSLDVPVVAVALDVARGVPECIRSFADRTHSPQAWTADLLAVLLEAVAGTATTVPDEAWIRNVTPDDLRLAVSRHRGATGSLERLRIVVQRRRASDDELPHVRDLSGYGDAKRVALDLLDDVEAYRDGRIAWQDVPRGLVLAGPTGTGKTFLVRCIARSAGLPLVVGSFAQWQSAGDGHLGDYLAAMHKSFAEARALAPSFLFLDEIDSIGDRQTFPARHRDYGSQVVNGLLEELDGAGDRTGVVVLAATNHPSRIDAAVLRPGRLDRVITLSTPDVPGLVGILRGQLGPDLADVDLTPVALAGRGGTGASVARWVRQARGAARRAGRTVVVGDLLAAVRDGRPSIPEADRRRIALHEAAHACAAVALDLGTLHGVSVHDTGGTTEIRSAVRTTTRTEAVATIVHLLAGRAAEKVFLGSVSAGAGGSLTSDLALATKVAFGIEGSWGLGEMGPIWLGEPDSDIAAYGRATGFGDAVGKLLRHAEREAERLVRANEKAVRRCADRLAVTGYLDADAALAALGSVAPFALAPTLGVAIADRPDRAD